MLNGAVSALLATHLSNQVLALSLLSRGSSHFIKLIDFAVLWKAVDLWRVVDKYFGALMYILLCDVFLHTV